MKNLFTYAFVFGSAIALAACASTTTNSGQEETRTQAPYAEERTVGVEEEVMVVRSAEPVFERRQVK